MPRVVDVNSEEVIKFSKKLDRISKSALPRAVRSTLDTLAFDTKKKTLLEEANKAFTQRNKAFYKRFSRVEKVSTNKINSMKSKVGMVDRSSSGTREQAGVDQTQQQLGGTIKGRTFIPLDSARVGKNNKRNVRKQNRLSNLKIALNTRNSRGANPKERFVKGAVFAVKKFGNDAIIQHRRDDGKEYLYRISRGGSDIKTREFGLKVEALYSVKRGRTVRVDAKPFTLRAALRSQKRTEKIFKFHAQRRINAIR